MKVILIAFIKAWRAVISPLYGDVCKYWPTCSAYGLEAVELHGALKGARLTIWRVLRCNPWSHGGLDPVPDSAMAHRLASERAAGRHGDPAAAGMAASTRADLAAMVPAPDFDSSRATAVLTLR